MEYEAYGLMPHYLNCKLIFLCRKGKAFKIEYRVYHHECLTFFICRFHKRSKQIDHKVSLII